jgi:hypothetical protein
MRSTRMQVQEIQTEETRLSQPRTDSRLPVVAISWRSGRFRWFWSFRRFRRFWWSRWLRCLRRFRTARFLAKFPCHGSAPSGRRIEVGKPRMTKQDGNTFTINVIDSESAEGYGGVLFLRLQLTRPQMMRRDGVFLAPRGLLFQELFDQNRHYSRVDKRFEVWS